MSSMAKIFVVVNLIIAIAAFGSAATLLGAQDDYKAALEETTKQHKVVVEAKDAEIKDLNDDLAAQTTTASNAVTARNTAEAENQTLKAQLQEMKTVNDRLNTSVEKLTQELGQLRATNNEYKTWLEKFGQESREATQDKLNFQKRWEEEVANRVRLEEDLSKTQEELTSLAAAKGDCDRQLRDANFWLGKYREKYGSIEGIPQGQPGKVLSVKGDLVSLSVGSNDGVRMGDTYQLRRGANYVGQVTVTKVYKDQAVGRFDTEFVGPGAPPQPGDSADPRGW